MLMKYATEEFLNEIDSISEDRIRRIRSTKDEITVSGTVYYVSNEGDDNNAYHTADNTTNEWVASLIL